MSNENSVWRLQTTNNERKIGIYSLENKAASVGWGDLPNLVGKKNISWEQYYEEARVVWKDIETQKKEKGEVGRKGIKDQLSPLLRLKGLEKKEGELIWLRSKGKYYIGRVSKDSIWKYDSSPDREKDGAYNQLTNIKWLPSNGLDESEVPGAVSTSLIRGSTFQRINKVGVFEYSAHKYDELADSHYYSHVKPISLTEKIFFNMLTPNDCEDLLCMWLFYNKGYMCIPSTNKISTQLYECVLVDPKTGKHVYIQVKKGSENIDYEAYTDLKGEVWLLSTEGKVSLSENYPNIKKVDPSDIFEFATKGSQLPSYNWEGEAKHLVPPSIKNWIELLDK